MKAATKNKRGRPCTIPGEMARIYNDEVLTEVEERACLNYYYATKFIFAVYGENLKPGTFFLTERKKVRRQGIAEQLGRMYCAGLIDEQSGKELAQTVIDEYRNGSSVKEIEKTLRFMRISLKNREVFLRNRETDNA